MTLAKAFRESNIQVGDIVELANVPDGISARIAEAIGEPEAELEGRLIEVTAIGDQKALYYGLTGYPIMDGQSDRSYKAYEWRRDDRESAVGGEKMIKKVGKREGEKIVWIFPDLANIYSRCQDG